VCLRLGSWDLPVKKRVDEKKRPTIVGRFLEVCLRYSFWA
jgi:hypothetical protein